MSHQENNLENNITEQKKQLIFYYDKDLSKPRQRRIEYLRQQVKDLQNIFQPEQRTPEWYEMRENMLTASDWGTVLGENHYAKSESVLMKKCGLDVPFFGGNAAMMWGNKYEAVAVLIYEYRNNVKVLEFGCLKHPFISFLGASPDGITEDGIMLEIKCPSTREITGIPPSYYWCQVQGQLEVCELDRCDFLECKIKEYECEQDYLNDNYNSDFFLNSFGNEKGVVAEFYKKVEKTFYYDYSPVGLLGNDLEIWKEEVTRKHCFNQNILSSGFAYWYLEIVSCVPIYRNQEWFNKAKIELGIFWDNVLKYRQLGMEQLKEDIQQNKINKKKMREEAKEIKNKDTKDTKKRERKSTSSSSSKSSSTQKNIKDFICLDDDDNSSFVKPVLEVQKENLYDESDDLIKCNISMFSDEPSSFEGVFHKLPQPSVSPTEIMRKLPISGEIKSNKDLINYNLSMFSDD